ncbi:MAG: U32 family peptidase [Spirochaetaceae bacterium]|jgi:putative protease|nr:U32 family peptidase [Spirochaetaceae bacterium]
MELSAPAGNIEKLRYAWSYGADAAYFGFRSFSLRMRADNFAPEDAEETAALKNAFPARKLYCALNVSFHNDDIRRLRESLDAIARFPIDGFIIQDLGVLDMLCKRFPQTPLHLSTQGNCINAEAARVYRSLGFSRIVLGREASLGDIRRIKDAVPEVELEAFVHGAMCVSYSGRCLLSAYFAGRSANGGNCAHSCRWDFRALAEGGALALEERERPGEYFPVFEGEGFTAMLSSRDLCMIGRLGDLRDAGVDSLKIEGRMKSVYYTALVSRAYRKALDALEGKISQEEAAPFMAELYNTPHRDFTTGFYYGVSPANETTAGKTKSTALLAGITGKALGPAEGAEIAAKNPALGPRLREGRRFYPFRAMNKLSAGTPLEVITPEIPALPLPPESYLLVDPGTGAVLDWVSHGHAALLAADADLEEGALVRIMGNL